ncbi:hypothetical protein AAG570_008368 [Ranatra chinensis]|uniref:Exonuclease domain-containing protein n=1 Tax=Ranatra chinensis TaxID=642074 RepID=A0ABD0XSY8_9HEMI
MWGTLYICCKREIHSAPCTTNKYHICELSKDDCLEGFVKTRPNNKLLSDMHAGVFAVDCEMCYTVRGSEITRVTVIDLNGKACFDKMIKPDFPILDYCTRFSGVTESDLVGITDRLPDIQKMLLKFINDKTILIGHSLDNDLRVLKILHNNVVDTSVVFPHKMGPPRKSALRYLAQEFLNVKIQDKGREKLFSL